MEGADEVLAGGGVDCGLAANARIHLCQQAGGQLDKMATALQNGGGKAGKVANNPAAKREDMIAALDFLLQQPVNRGGKLRPAFRGLARWR